MTKKLTIKLLGEATIEIGEKPVSGLTVRKGPALLFYLACQPRPYAREFLADFLWDDRPPDQAAANLRSLLSSLRRKLKPYLVITRHTVAFNQDAPYWLDVEEFKSRLAPLDGWTEETTLAQTAVTRLQEAVALYQENFLRGFHIREARNFEEWAVMERERLRRLAMTALKWLVTHHLRSGSYTTALEYGQRLLHLEPYSEEACRHVMMLLARNGRRNAALKQYEKCRHTLAKELGVSPSPATTALYRRLRTIHTPPPCVLPPAPTQFVGREQALAEITTTLANPDCRLLTLIGPGGIGKTRLALQAAQQIAATRAEMFLHGIYFVSLAPLNSAELLISTIAGVLNLTFHGPEEPQTQLLNYLRDRELLLLLDNFEHIMEGVDLLATLLQQAPAVKIMVTSRERLYLHEEWLFDIHGLTAPEEDTPRAAETYSAVQLFLQRAQRVSRHFAPTTADMEAIVGICRFVEGTPLAVELAAASVRHQSCTAIAAELTRNLDTLTNLLRNVPSRHRSLQAVFAHSWALLSDAEHEAVMAISVFRGSFTQTTAQSIMAVSPTTLSTLANKSFLRTYQTNGRDAAARFEMHQLIKHYAAGKLAQLPGRQQAVEEAHTTYYAGFLAQRTPTLKAAAQKTLQEIGQEIEEIRAAWAWAVDHHRPTLLATVLDGIWYFFWARGWQKEAEKMFAQAAVSLANDGKSRLLLARIQMRQAEIQMHLSKYEAVKTLLDQSIPILEQHEAWEDLGWAYDCLADIDFYRGNYTAAQPYYEKSLALFRQANNTAAIAHALTKLGHILSAEKGHYAGAVELYQESLAIYQQINDKFGQAKCIINLGSVAQLEKAYGKAREFYEEGIRLCREIDNRHALAIALNNLGTIAAEEQNYAQSEALLQEGLDIKREIGDRYSIVHSLKHLGDMATQMGRYRRAKTFFDEALTISNELESVMLTTFVLTGVASLLAARGKLEQAVEILYVVLNNASKDVEVKTSANELLAAVEPQLSPQTAATCRQQAQTKSLATAVTQILSHS